MTKALQPLWQLCDQSQPNAGAIGTTPRAFIVTSLGLIFSPESLPVAAREHKLPGPKTSARAHISENRQVKLEHVLLPVVQAPRLERFGRVLARIHRME
jgi:hypothetical protein